MRNKPVKLTVYLKFEAPDAIDEKTLEDEYGGSLKLWAMELMHEGQLLPIADQRTFEVTKVERKD